MFLTTTEFLPQHHAQRQQTLQIITAAEANRHRRWLGHAHETTQHDLTPAHRRLKGILARNDDRAWAWTEFRMAWNMTRAWHASDIERMPALARRWHNRAAALAVAAIVTTPDGKRAAWIVAFPEAVALTEILTDLNLRRHVARSTGGSPRPSASSATRPGPTTATRSATGPASTAPASSNSADGPGPAAPSARALQMTGPAGNIPQDPENRPLNERT